MYTHTGIRHQTLGRSVTRVQRRRTPVLAAVAFVTLLVASSVTSGASPTNIGLGAAGSYSVLAGSTVTNICPSTLGQSVGLSPGSSVVGFPPGTVLGEIHIGEAAEQAKADLAIAYENAAGRSLTGPPLEDLTGRHLTAGVYGSASSLLLSGLLILDGEGDPNSVFIFKAVSELIIGSGAQVQLIGNAQACNVFWQVGTSATVGSGAFVTGSIMALASITLGTGAAMEGRALARNAAVTLDTNTILQPGCDLSADNGNGDNGNGDNGNGDNGNGDNGNGNGDDDTTATTVGAGDSVLVDTGPGLVLAILIGGLALLLVGGGTMAVAKRRRSDLQ